MIKYGYLWTIKCTERNTKGRTMFVKYYRHSKEKITSIKGEILDSEDDYNSIIELNKSMEKVRREFIIKNWKSEISASKIIIK